MNKATIKFAKTNSSNLIKYLNEANNEYAENNPGNAAHPWGPKRFCLTAALLKSIQEDSEKGPQHMVELFGEATLKKQIEHHDAIALVAKHPSILGQMKMLLTWMGQVTLKNTDGSHNWALMKFMACFDFTITKKKDAYLIRFGFQNGHILSLTWHFLICYLQSHGGQVLDGAAPKGPLFHFGKKVKKEEKA